MLINRVGILTSGGDAPGMNAAIRAITRAGIFYGIEVLGFKSGFSGLINNEYSELSARSVSGILEMGGTILKTARSSEFKEESGQNQALLNLHSLGVDGLIIIGGNGSQTGAYKLYEKGFKIVGVASTIDNDLYGFDYTIGFDTAVNTALDAIDKIRDTALSHERIFVVEVMGRDSGHIALEAGISSGADIILTPEIPFNFNDIVLKIESDIKNKKLHHVIVTAEGAVSSSELVNFLKEKIKLDVRGTVLGYVQRGGSPTRFDRLLASEAGILALNALMRGESGLVFGMKNGGVEAVLIKEAISKRNPLKHELVELLMTVSI